MSQAAGPPDRSRCPLCGAALPGPRCAACGADLAGPIGDELWWIDNQLFTLPQRRAELIDQLRATAAATRPGAAHPAWVPPPPPTTTLPGLPPPPAPWPPPGSAAAPAAVVRPAGPEVSSILLALGVGLLVVAALVFAVVTWERLGALGQGAVLVGLTLAAGWGTRAAARRGLTGTAEALGVLTVLMGPLLAQAVRITIDLPGVDDLSWGNWRAWSWWPGVLALVGLAAIAFGRWVGIRSAPYIGVVLVQVTPPAWFALSPLPTTVVALALVAQAAVVGAGPTDRERAGPARSLWVLGAVAAWLLALVVAFASAPGVDAEIADRWGAVAAFGAGALVAAWWLRRPLPGVTDPVVVVAGATAAFLGAARALGGSVPDVAFWPCLGLLAVAALGWARRWGGERGRALARVSWVAVAVAAVPVADAIAAAALTAGGSDEAWRGDLSARVEASTGLGLDPAWVSLAVGATVLAAAGWVDRRRLPASELTWAGWALAAATALALPAVVGASLAAVLGVALGVAVVLAALGWWADDWRPAATTSLAALAAAVAWAAPDASLLLAPGVLAVALGAAGTVAGVRRAAPSLAAAGAGLGVAAVVADAALLAARAGAAAPWTWAVASVAATAVAALAAWAAPRRTVPTWAAGPDADDPSAVAVPGAASASGAAGAAAEAVAIGLHLAAILGVVTAAGDLAALADPATLALAAGSVGFAVLAARQLPSEVGWWSAGLGAVELLALVWLRLAHADVSAPEAYTLPLAALLAGAAWLAATRRPGGAADLPSWQLEGPALATALGPTALVTLGDPGLTRQLVGLAAGAVLLGLGAARRRRAPVDVGAAVLTVVGLQALLPYADDVPRWLSLGLAGAVLVALGATFEERRRDLGQARRRYAALR